MQPPVQCIAHMSARSTHKVLEDALTHGFVQIAKLALLVYDEGRMSFSSLCGFSYGLTWQHIIVLADTLQTRFFRTFIIQDLQMEIQYLIY